MLDEFPQLGQMECIELALAICAGYGIKICIVSQDVNQLNKAYTKDNSIGSNCHLHIYFTPNIDNGGATAESISKTLGKQTIKTVSHSGGGFMKGSDSTSTTGRELMTPDEVSHMSSEKEIVFVAGHKPIFGDKLRYYLQPMFTRRLMNPPGVSDIVTQVGTYDELREQLNKESEKLEKQKKEVLKENALRHNMTPEEYVAAQEKERELREEAFLERLHPNKKPQGAEAEKNKVPAQNSGSTKTFGNDPGREGTTPPVGGTRNPFGRRSRGAKERLCREQMAAMKQKQYNIEHPEAMHQKPPEAIEVDEDVREIYDLLNAEEKENDEKILNKEIYDEQTEAQADETKPEVMPEDKREETPATSPEVASSQPTEAKGTNHMYEPRHASHHRRDGHTDRFSMTDGFEQRLAGVSTEEEEAEERKGAKVEPVTTSAENSGEVAHEPDASAPEKVPQELAEPAEPVDPPEPPEALDVLKFFNKKDS